MSVVTIRGVLLTDPEGGSWLTRVLLYTKAPILARGFASLLTPVVGLEIDSICDDVASLAERITVAAPDIVLMDFDSEQDLEAVTRVLARTPHIKVVLWAHRPSVEMAYQAMNLGVRGVLRKTLSPESTVRCLQKVASGETWFEKDLTARFMEGRGVSLTPRESELVTLLSQGFKNKEISAALSITEATVRVYLSALFRKVGVKDRYELALFGLRNMASRMTADIGDPKVRLLVLRKAPAVQVRHQTAAG